MEKFKQILLNFYFLRTKNNKNIIHSNLQPIEHNTVDQIDLVRQQVFLDSRLPIV
jgi:hypothetical protein